MYVSRRKIQKLMDNSKRAGMTDDGKKLGEFDLVDRLARTELKKQHVCLYYRKDDSTADPSSARGAQTLCPEPSLRSHPPLSTGFWQIIISDEGCLNDAARYGPNGHSVDGKYRMVEDNL